MIQSFQSVKKALLLSFMALFLAYAKGYAYSGYVGQTLHLSAPSASGAIVDAAAWYTDDNSSLSVSGDEYGGTVRIDAYFSGTRTVTCQYAYRYYFGGKMQYGHGSVDYTITCKKSTLTLNERRLTLKPGDEVELEYTNSSGYSLPFVRWLTDDVDIASINGDDHAYGKKSVTVTAEAPGECVITCDGKTGEDAPTCTITVEATPPTGISFTKRSITIQQGKTGRFAYKLTPTDAYTKISWASSDESVATVNRNGLISAVSEGIATITATTDNGLSASGTVEVTPQPEQVSLPNGLQIAVGYSMKIEPSLTPTNATTTYKWITDDESVVAIDKSGVARGMAIGTANITVTTENKKTATCRITVTEPAANLDHRNAAIRVDALKRLIDKSLDNLK